MQHLEITTYYSYYLLLIITSATTAASQCCQGRYRMSAYLTSSADQRAQLISQSCMRVCQHLCPMIKASISHALNFGSF